MFDSDMKQYPNFVTKYNYSVLNTSMLELRTDDHKLSVEIGRYRNCIYEG